MLKGPVTTHDKLSNLYENVRVEPSLSGPVAMISPGPDRWPTHQENDYTDGGICNNLEPASVEQLKQKCHKMLVLHLTVDESLRVEAHSHGAPEGLNAVFREAIDYVARKCKAYLLEHNIRTFTDTLPPLLPGTARDTGESANQERSLQDRERSVETVRQVQFERVQAADGAESTRASGLKRALDESEEQGMDPYSRRAVDDAGAHSSDEGAETERQDDDDDEELHRRENIMIVRMSDAAKIRDWYFACFKRIQQTACRQIAQSLVKVVHPKKQTNFPYNGAKRSSSSRRDDLSSIPQWWPDGVPHKEPAHMKTPERMELLMHILCNLRNWEGTGPQAKGVCVEDMRKATNDEKGCKISPRARKWLNTIYEVRRAEEQHDDGCAREFVSMHKPTNKRSRKHLRRRKTEAMHEEERNDETARFDDDLEGEGGNLGESSTGNEPQEEALLPVDFNGEPYYSSEGEDGPVWLGGPIRPTYSGPFEPAASGDGRADTDASAGAGAGVGAGQAQGEEGTTLFGSQMLPPLSSLPPPLPPPLLPLPPPVPAQMQAPPSFPRSLPPQPPPSLSRQPPPSLSHPPLSSSSPPGPPPSLPPPPPPPPPGNNNVRIPGIRRLLGPSPSTIAATPPAQRQSPTETMPHDRDMHDGPPRRSFGSAEEWPRTDAPNVLSSLPLQRPSPAWPIPPSNTSPLQQQQQRYSPGRFGQGDTGVGGREVWLERQAPVYSQAMQPPPVYGPPNASGWPAQTGSRPNSRELLIEPLENVRLAPISPERSMNAHQMASTQTRGPHYQHQEVHAPPQHQYQRYSFPQSQPPQSWPDDHRYDPRN